MTELQKPANTDPGWKWNLYHFRNLFRKGIVSNFDERPLKFGHVIPYPICYYCKFVHQHITDDYVDSYCNFHELYVDNHDVCSKFWYHCINQTTLKGPYGWTQEDIAFMLNELKKMEFD